MNNVRPIRIAIVGALLVGLMATVACTSDQLTSSLDAAVTAAEIALPIVSDAAGLSPQLSSQLGDYVATVAAAADKSVAILDDKSLSDAQRAAAVSAAFADAIAQSSLIKNLPAGTPATVIHVVTAVVDAVNHFLAKLHVAQAQMSATPSFAFGFTGSASSNVKLDHKKLHKIQKRARALAAKKS